MAKKNWIQGAIKHPGAEKNAAARAGESTHEYMEQHKDSPGTAGKRARLGLELEGMHHGRQFGGPMAPGKPYLVGEAGPEVVQPKVPSVVRPNRMPIRPNPVRGAVQGMRGPTGPSPRPKAPRMPGIRGTADFKGLMSRLQRGK